MFLKSIFDNKIDNDEKIICWKNRYVQKSDIFIKYNNYVKGISLKCGKDNSIHQEPVQEFKSYLAKLCVPYEIIDKYMSYHYGYGRDNNGNIDFSVILSSLQYKTFYQAEIDLVNSYINKTRIIVDMIDRFIIKGKNSDYGIDALICGTVDDFVWIMKDDLYDLILSKRCLEFTSPHVACMTLGPKKRNLNRKSENFKDRYILCVRWNYIREDITRFKNKLCRVRY